MGQGQCSLCNTHLAPTACPTNPYKPFKYRGVPLINGTQKTVTSIAKNRIRNLKILITPSDCDNVVCFKDSSADTRRFIDIRNQVGDRFVLFAGLDDVVLENLAVGVKGWVSGMSNVFPKEGETILRLAKAGRFAEAMPIYECLMPILHLDARADLVQCIKLCEAIAGRGSALTRPPHLALPQADREYVEQIMAKALANRPHLPDVGL